MKLEKYFFRQTVFPFREKLNIFCFSFLPDVSGCIRMYSDVFGCIRMYPDEAFIKIINAYEANNIPLYDQLLAKFQENIARSEYTREFDNRFNDSGQVDIRIAECVMYVRGSGIFYYIINNNLAKSFVHLINYFRYDIIVDCLLRASFNSNLLDAYILNIDGSDCPFLLTRFEHLWNYKTLNYVMVRKVIQHSPEIYWWLYKQIIRMNENNIELNYKNLNIYLKYADVNKDYSTRLALDILRNHNDFILSILITYNLVPKNNYCIIRKFYCLVKKNPQKFAKLFDKYLLSFGNNDFVYDACFIGLFRKAQKEAKFCKWFLSTFPNAPFPDELLLKYYIEVEDIYALRLYKYIGVKPTEEDLKNSPQEIRKLFWGRTRPIEKMIT